MMNHAGIKTRLTFKSETSELWIGTAERTQKISYSTIREVVSEKIPKVVRGGFNDRENTELGRERLRLARENTTCSGFNLV
jgi:hypothetical protein